MGVLDFQRARLLEVLSRLDRVATVSRGHRAGLHLYDRSLLDQYMTILMVWEAEAQRLSALRGEPEPTTVSATVEEIARRLQIEQRDH